MTYTIAGVFRPDLGSSADGLTVQGYPVSSWVGSAPSLGTSPPGSPPVSATTGTSFGDHGAWELALPTNEDYYVVVEYSASYYWQRCNAPAWTDGVQTGLDVTTDVGTGQIDADNVAIAGVSAYGLSTDPFSDQVQPLGTTNVGSASDGAIGLGAFVDHEHAGLGQSLQIVTGMASTRYVGAVTSGEPGAPLSGSYAAGDFAIDQTGGVWIYNGTTWVEVLPPGSAGATGDLKAYSGITTPAGWLVCDGSSVSELSYPDLFGVLTLSFTGTSHGSTTIDGISTLVTDVLEEGWAITGGDIPSGTTITAVASGSISISAAATGSNMGESLVAAPWGISGTISPYDFNLPDLRGRVAVGAGSGAGLTPRSLGPNSAGAEEVTLTAAELPVSAYGDLGHNHPDPGHVHNEQYMDTLGSGTLTIFIDGANYAYTNEVGLGTSTWTASGGANLETGYADISNAGGGSAHNNMQPFASVNWLIKT